MPLGFICQKLKPFRTDIKRTFYLIKENRFCMEKTNFYMGIENFSIHVIEHYIIINQNILFDNLKSGKISSILNLNY